MNIELKTDDEKEVFKWVWENFKIFNQARKVRAGKIILNVDIYGKIKTKYEISGDMDIYFTNEGRALDKGL